MVHFSPYLVTAQYSPEKFLDDEGVVLGPFALMQRVTSRTERTCQHADGQSASPKCHYDGGCAYCVPLSVVIPGNAQIHAIRYYSTANYPDDHGSPQLTSPGENAWSLMEPAQQTSDGTFTTIFTIFHNCSHNRDRRAALEVDYSFW